MFILSKILILKKIVILPYKINIEHNKFFEFLNEYTKLSKEETKIIKNSFTPKKIKKGQILINKNEPCNRLFFINKEPLIICRNNDCMECRCFLQDT